MAAAPLRDLAGLITEIASAQADAIHFDVEDGVFVPVLAHGTRLIADLRPLTDLPFDVHLSVCNPEWLIPELAAMGADWVAVHVEACPYPHHTLGLIRKAGMRAGLAINPATPLPELRYLQPVLDYVLILTTEPEYPDAAFLPEVLHKIAVGRRMLPDDAGIEWIVDGGVDAHNLPHIVQRGATSIVAGRSAFQGGDIRQNLARLREAALTGGFR
jgi:ribulose-phosphate 3-epimerase